MVHKESIQPASRDLWPNLDLAEWQDTYATLHMWTQIVGKIRLVQTPWVNHSWHVTLYLTSRGLTTSPIPYGVRTFQIDFDFIDHRLSVETSDGSSRDLRLEARSVADFYEELFARLSEFQIDVKIDRMPNEVADPVPFHEDRQHTSYDPESANRFWRALAQADRVFKRFRAGYLGKCSPVHFFWGSFDLAVTRFSGRTAPEHPGGIPYLPDWVTREAYSHEVSSCGFWPGGGPLPFPLFYTYFYPQPSGYEAAKIRPVEASYASEMGEFILPYEEVRVAESPDEMLLEFLTSTYEAGADLAEWDRAALERGPRP